MYIVIINDIFCNKTIFVLVLSETKGDVILNLIKKILNNLIITIHLCISVKLKSVKQYLAGPNFFKTQICKYNI